MPDVKEVYEMVTKQKPSDPGALERQRIRQVRTMRNRRLGAFAVAAAIGAVAVVVVVASLGGQTTTDRTMTEPDPTSMEVATGFMDAYAASDVDQVMTYLANDADLSTLIEWLEAQGIEGQREQFRMLFSLFDAQSFRVIPDSCVEQGRSESVTTLRCDYDFHALGSDELGRGPFRGSYFDLIVRDGTIRHVSGQMEIGQFSPLVWEPFAEWVSTTHPEDAAVMYTDETTSLERVSEESIRLWRRHVRGYVDAVQSGDAA